MIERTVALQRNIKIKEFSSSKNSCSHIDQEELKELGREPFYKKLLKNEVDLYIDSDNSLTEQSLRVSVQEEKVNYLEAVLRQINNRGFQIKNAIDWNRFITG